MSENIIDLAPVGRFPVLWHWLQTAYRLTNWAAKLAAGALGFVVGLLATFGFFGGLVQPDKEVGDLAHWVTGGDEAPDVIAARVLMLLALLVGGGIWLGFSLWLSATWEAFPWRKSAAGE